MTKVNTKKEKSHFILEKDVNKIPPPQRSLDHFLLTQLATLQAETLASFFSLEQNNFIDHICFNNITEMG